MYHRLVKTLPENRSSTTIRIHLSLFPTSRTNPRLHLRLNKKSTIIITFSSFFLSEFFNSLNLFKKGIRIVICFSVLQFILTLFINLGQIFQHIDNLLSCNDGKYDRTQSTSIYRTLINSIQRCIYIDQDKLHEKKRARYYDSNQKYDNCRSEKNVTGFFQFASVFTGWIYTEPS